MVSEARRLAADQAIGTRHPYRTLYGRRIITAVVVLVVVVLLVLAVRAGVHAVAGWSAPGWAPAAAGVLVVPPLAKWYWSPGKRMDRRIRRLGRRRRFR